MSPFIHPCEAPGCVRLGIFGYGVNLLRNRRGTWYCAAHRPDKQEATNGSK